MDKDRFSLLQGNDDIYSLKNVVQIKGSPLEGKHICFLGSSVTLGYASLGESFADFVGKGNNAYIYKEAVNGTTLVLENEDSYVSRLMKIDKKLRFDLFVCQLSTNDASRNKPLGNIDDKDPKTICGAINTIFQYVKDTWGCPIVFYTNCYFESKSYSLMVEALNKISISKNISLIDLYNDKDFNSISSSQRSLFMADCIHPTRAGYLKWWVPVIEETLYKMIKRKPLD